MTTTTIHRRVMLLGLLIQASCLALASAACAVSWVEQTFEDFADGRLDASGQNLYVSRDGTIRTIHRFDLNQDGHLDLIFNNTHDTRTYIPATLGTIDGTRRIRQSDLAVAGSQKVEVADLNLDGHLDVVFCPNASGIQHPRRFLTIIWGGTDGWPAHRANGVLPVNSAADIAVADLNHDGWPDIVALCLQTAWMIGQPEGRIVRVYWGGEGGFLLTRRKDLGVPDARQMTAGDFDNDGADDLAVLAAQKKLHLFWSNEPGEGGAETEPSVLELPQDGSNLAAGDVNGDGQTDLIVSRSDGPVQILPAQAGRSWSEPIEVAGLAASRMAVGDLDNDGLADLVLTSLETGRAAGGEQAAATTRGVVRIAWGSADGFSVEQSTVLPADHASATAIGDLDSDGRPDLAVAVFQFDKSFQGRSPLFFNVGGRRFEKSDEGLLTTGATDVAIAPATDDMPARVVLCNSTAGTLGEDVPLDVYWGGPNGFDPKNHWAIPFTSGYEASAADLNADDHVDLILMNSGHGRQKDNPTLGANIFWGSVEGFDLEHRRTVLNEESLLASNVADLDRDGYLDLVLGALIDDPDRGKLVLHYGTAAGFDGSRRVVLPAPGRTTGCVVADFNRDDWLDVAVSPMQAELVVIFWGSPQGFDADRQDRLDMAGVIPLEAADLNADGWLDLIAGSYHDPIEKYHDTGTTIFWGGPRGFQHWNAQWLPGMTPVGLTVADFDADGYLDYFSPHYHGTATRESIACYLYWGGPDGLKSARKTILICDSVSDSMAGDFDHDGRLDLAVSCHTEHGDHNTNSLVFYNNGQRFTNPRVTKLPTHGTHWMYVQDVGHIYHRKWEQTYESSIFTWDQAATSGRLTHEADLPEDTQLIFAVRSAESEDQLAQRAWRVLSSQQIKLEPDDRHLQYRATFMSDNGDRYPVLERVEVEVGRE